MAGGEAMRVEEWRFETKRAVAVVVPPDGCQDLIGRRDARGRTRWLLFPLAAQTIVADVPAGSASRGFRLSPGSSLAAHLPALLTELDLDDARVEERLRDHAALAPQIADALEALRRAERVEGAAALLGVGARRLERMTAPTGRPPRFWLGLARARRAARALAQGSVAQAEIALAHGYCDQAHLARAMRRWFGATPGALASDAELAAALAQSGYE
jgi:AraC-like DNA-binding protein